MFIVIAEKIREWVYKFAFGEIIQQKLELLNKALTAKNVEAVKNNLLDLVNQPGLMPGNEKQGILNVLLQGYEEKAHAKTPGAKTKAEEIVKILSNSKSGLQKALKAIKESKNPLEDLSKVQSLVKEVMGILIKGNKIVLDGLIREFNQLNIPTKS